MKQSTFRLPDEEFYNFKAKCALAGITMNDKIQEFVSGFLGEKEEVKEHKSASDQF